MPVKWTISKINLKTECCYCQEDIVEGFFIWSHIPGYRVALTPNLLCAKCLASLHSITNPLSVLVMTGTDTKKE
jgi:hypothetical protein